MEGELLIRVEEAAQRLAIGRSTIYEAIRRGELESIRIGTARRIPVSALESYVTRQRKAQGDYDGAGGLG